MSSCHPQTYDLGKVMGTKAMEAFGPSDIYCSLGSLGADVVMVDIPWGILYRGTSWTFKSEGLLGWQIHMLTSLPPCFHLAVCYGLGDGSLTFLDCQRVSSKVGLFSNWCTCSNEQECSISSLVYGNVISKWTSPIENNCPTWACHHSFGEASPNVMQHIFY